MTKKHQTQLSRDIAADGALHIAVDYQADDEFTIHVRIV